MCFAKILPDDIKKLNADMHQMIDEFTDTMKNEVSKPEQVESSMNDLEDKIKERILDTAKDRFQGQQPELTPLLEGETDAVRRRSNRPPVLEVQDPKTQEPEESFCDMVKRWFRAMMQRLQTWWQNFVAWLQKMVTFLWEKFESFCCSLAELLGSFFSTKESH
ncbi:interleukin-32 [Saimiri boliviensis]|uniref:interleukin-32 n=1 Tax=Saimiri boliviensis TaxID=27679 RepID=UPI00193E05FF|nr:interleukin-32-like [Saimiri boliviensis boliviensis]XP_039333654.1 interleukin-32-like [Saimiri boliviensis boliviensis]